MWANLRKNPNKIIIKVAIVTDFMQVGFAPWEVWKVVRKGDNESVFKTTHDRRKKFSAMYPWM